MEDYAIRQELEHRLSEIEHDLFTITSGRKPASQKNYKTLYAEKVKTIKELCTKFYLYHSEAIDLSDADYVCLYDNLKAFYMNFGPVYLRSTDSGIEIYVNGHTDTYEDFAYNVDYLNGWLYGCVKVNNKRIKPLKELS